MSYVTFEMLRYVTISELTGWIRVIPAQAQELQDWNRNAEFSKFTEYYLPLIIY